MSFKNIIKVANYYNVKYGFQKSLSKKDGDESPTKFHTYEILDCEENPEQNYHYVIKVQFEGMYHGKPLVLTDSIEYYLKFNSREGTVEVKEENYVDPHKNEDFKAILDGEELTGEELYSFIEEDDLDHLLSDAWHSDALISDIQECEAIKDGIVNLIDAENEAYEDSVDPLGSRGLRFGPGGLDRY